MGQAFDARLCQHQQFYAVIKPREFGIKGGYFVGVNKFKLIFTPYLIIRAPFTATNLANLHHRIAIARNGFNVLNEWKQNIFFAPWIPIYQAQIGRGEGLYQPIGAR